ncbi:MAG: archaellin/type IV pilin N-terminal domain-containing protein [Methanoregulaceae archaeon]
MKYVTADDAFTGLEAAIVLIAFVVVAAVFSYVVLSAGFFTTQKSQQVVQTSMQQASSSLEVVGNVYGFANGTDNLGYLSFTVANTAGESAIDVPKMVVSYQDATTRWANLSFTEGNTTTGESVKSSQKWGINRTYNDIGTPNHLLERGEQFTLVVGMPPSATPDTQITTNLQPAVGAVFQIKRTIPPALSRINILF